MTAPEQQAVALELERLRGTMEAGFARVDGQLALLVQRGDQTDRRLDDHENRLDAIERAKWIGVGAGLVLGGAAGAVTRLFGG